MQQPTEPEHSNKDHLEPHETQPQAQPNKEGEPSSREEESREEGQPQSSADVKQQEEEEHHRGLRPRKKQKVEPKPKVKHSKKKKKQKRQMKEIEVDDPRYRGVPKSKKIRKRRNKPKPISDQAKQEAQLKREEEEHQRRISTRGRKPVIKKLRTPRKNTHSKPEVKLEADLPKLEDSAEEHSSERGKAEALRAATGRFGQLFRLEMDPSCRFYSQYKCRQGEIEKAGKLYCQIYNRQPVPGCGRHYFQVKIARLSFQSVTVGVITADNFSQQYSRDKPSCVCFDAYTHSTYVEGARTELQAHLRLNDVIRTVVDLPATLLQWFLNNDLLAEAVIPPHMASQPLFPFLELSNKWIKLKINDFQQ